MPLRLIRAGSNAALWGACAGRFLDAVEREPEPAAPGAHLWIAHRWQRDSLYEAAAARRLPGWLAPPVSFLSELRELFRIRKQPIGILAGRLLVARLAARHGRRHGFGSVARARGPARAHMLDSVFSELLPEGVGPAELREALERLGGDAFARRRDAWVADTYEAFLDDLDDGQRFDPRSIHALVAERIEAGELQRALRGAPELHVFGIVSLRGRRRLFRALAEQAEVAVWLYLPLEDEAGEWEEELPVEEVEVLSSDAPAGAGASAPAAAGEPSEAPPPRVQPAPDALREAGWVARAVKRLLAEGEVEPWRVAVVARSGHRDTRLIHRALLAAGVPSTARLRTVLAEIPALKALLELFRAEARGWDYRSLRGVLTSPYFPVGIDLRAIDRVAGSRRVEGLEAWIEALERLRSRLDGDEGRRAGREGVYADRLDRDIARLEAFRDTVGALSGERDEREWIARTLEVMDGWFGYRRRLCRVDGERHDVVRLDQRGVLALESLLREWRTLVDEAEPFGAEEWHARLRRLLEANELAHSTPLQTGVQVLEAHEAALTPFERVFVVHANDGVFPRASRQTGVFSEAERRRLREAGLPLTHRDLALRRERTLWRAVTGGPRVTVSYRTTDAGGVPLLPSLMVPEHDPATELPRTLDLEARLEGTEARGELTPASPAQHRRREVQRLARLRRSGDRGPFATPDPVRIRRAVLAAFAEELRSGRLDPFLGSAAALLPGGAPGAADTGDPARAFALDRPLSERPHPWNGRLRDPVVLAELGRRFGEDRPWSATQLQSYAIRPFDFLLDRVLQLGEVEEAEEETTPLTFGSVAHDLLESFYRAAESELPAALAGPPEEAFSRLEAIWERVAEEVFRRHEEDVDAWLGLPPIWAVRREDIRDKVRAFLAKDLKNLAKDGERPVLLEVDFGYDEDAPAPELAGADARGRPAALRLRGRIDRVDLHEGGDGPWLRVIDYKSGGTPSPGGYDDGALLQTALYMRALELSRDRLPEVDEAEVRCGVFRSVKNTYNASPLRRHELEGVLRLALSIPTRVRAGLFEAVQARSTAAAPWQPGPELTRTAARISSGSRFDPVTGEPDDG